MYILLHAGRYGGRSLDSVTTLISKLVEVEIGELPLVVRAAQAPAGHILIVQLVRFSDWLPPNNYQPAAQVCSVGSPATDQDK